jgi:hypothetical protein
MKVYSLVEGFDYEGHSVRGVFGSIEDLLQAVREKQWGGDWMGYIVSDLGKVIDLDYIECVSFVRLDGEFVEVE